MVPFAVVTFTAVAIAGGLALVWTRRLELSVYVQGGLILLIGLSRRNAILIVEFAKRQYDEEDNSLVDAAN